jgi:hypothetical protein
MSLAAQLLDSDSEAEVTTCELRTIDSFFSALHIFLKWEETVLNREVAVKQGPRSPVSIWLLPEHNYCQRTASPFLATFYFWDCAFWSPFLCIIKSIA